MPITLPAWAGRPGVQWLLHIGQAPVPPSAAAKYYDESLGSMGAPIRFFILLLAGRFTLDEARQFARAAESCDTDNQTPCEGYFTHCCMVRTYGFTLPRHRPAPPCLRRLMDDHADIAYIDGYSAMLSIQILGQETGRPFMQEVLGCSFDP